jgi:hypothetical protein
MTTAAACAPRTLNPKPTANTAILAILKKLFIALTSLKPAMNLQVAVAAFLQQIDFFFLAKLGEPPSSGVRSD